MPLKPAAAGLRGGSPFSFSEKREERKRKRGPNEAEGEIGVHCRLLLAISKNRQLK